MLFLLKFKRKRREREEKMANKIRKNEMMIMTTMKRRRKERDEKRDVKMQKQNSKSCFCSKRNSVTWNIKSDGG